jgi:hypothetical protein
MKGSRRRTAIEPQGFVPLDTAKLDKQVINCHAMDRISDIIPQSLGDDEPRNITD